jgi:hypothetical protein
MRNLIYNVNWYQEIAQHAVFVVYLVLRTLYTFMLLEIYEYS